MTEISDEEFVAQLAAVEAEAEAKRLKVSHPTPSPSPGGAYIEALKGSKGTLFNPQSTPRTNTTLLPPFSDDASGTCFTCGKPGHWARDCHFKGSTDVPDKHCPCGLGLCNVLTAKTDRNSGRKFYRCPIRQESGGCGFFDWCDNVAGPEIAIEPSNPSTPELSCPCGAGSCLILTAKTEKNRGQQFYKCPTTQGGCGFFKWCREAAATAGNLSSVYIAPASEVASGMINKSYNSSNSSCYKCGKDGHWAKDCTQSSSYTFPTSQSTINTSYKSNISSNSSCYKCGKEGHWARDCDQSFSNDHSSRTVKTATSGSCFKCGNTGHWAKDCSSPSDTKARYGQ